MTAPEITVETDGTICLDGEPAAYVSALTNDPFDSEGNGRYGAAIAALRARLAAPGRLPEGLTAERLREIAVMFQRDGRPVAADDMFRWAAALDTGAPPADDWDPEKVCGVCEVAGHDFASCPRRPPAEVPSDDLVERPSAETEPDEDQPVVDIMQALEESIAAAKEARRAREAALQEDR